MIDIKIEQGIPLSPSERGRTTSALWRQMLPGDSFVWPSGRRSAAGYATRIGRVMGWKMATRRIDDDHTRIWRME